MCLSTGSTACAHRIQELFGKTSLALSFVMIHSADQRAYPPPPVVQPSSRDGCPRVRPYPLPSSGIGSCSMYLSCQRRLVSIHNNTAMFLIFSHLPMST